MIRKPFVTRVSLTGDGWRRYVCDRAGIATVEFAIIVPILLLILVAMADFGLVLYARFGLNENVSASANYAIVKASDVSSSGGAGLATSLASVVPSTVDVTVVVNNGPSVTRTSGVSSSSGTASNADSCYCPTVSGSTVTWGSAMTCKSACSGSGLAGKFVSINASVAYSPLFGSYGFVRNGTLSTFTIVQVQ
jgi:Flp pilus assembly protein TadG